MKFIIGKKINMTQVFKADGATVAVTKVIAGPCSVTLTGEKMVQIGFDIGKEYLMKKPALGHLKGLPLTKELRSFKLENASNLKRGDLITVETFTAGDIVNVTGISKGKGFAGVVKRHHFAGGPASHGHKDNLRAPGSIGAGGVQRVFKNMRMAGHMGTDKVTIKNLEIVKIDSSTNELYIKGAVPGGRNSILIITAPGELKITALEVKKEDPKVENIVEPAVVEAENTNQNPIQ